MMSTHDHELQHFSHEHPLIYVDKETLKGCCSACGVALLSSPSYKCGKDHCNFFLHQQCAELPQFSGPNFIHGNYYNLVLLAKPPHDNCKCIKCGSLCKNFTYKCSRQLFRDRILYVHSLCAFPLEISVKHISHKHSLTAMCREASLICDGCGREQKGTFFCCQKCSFYIYQDCCLLPDIVEINHHHDHLVSLTYFLADTYFRHKYCLICKDEISLSFGAYICGFCNLGTHIYCATSTLKEGEIVQSSIRLPKTLDTFPSLIMCGLLGNKDDGEIKDVKSKIEKYHNDHSSWIVHHQENDTQMVCNACIQPVIISPPPSHYSCPQPHCDFILHQFCANLPPVIKNYFLSKPLNLFSESNDFCSSFFCFICNKECNGFGYKSTGAILSIDVECAAAPIIINHESHSQHLLALSRSPRTEHFCCDILMQGPCVYACRLCNYYIHVHCAFLPKTVKHKFDEHPLDLIYNPSIQIPRKQKEEAEEEKEYYHMCEFCEEDIEPKLWFYYCGKCDQSFHVKCIPSTGELSKVKFGRSLALPRQVHDHPVTLTRMLTIGSQKCGYCNRMIRGFIDHMSFHCSMCDFWIHFECTKRNSSQDGLCTNHK
ncbi:uncharacterized protein [Henckelia pumila]|uniref:uncharacterized protein n=1 Tax=Henckelia pumila TaxID=405737 RepID=UPI003C6E9393